MQKITYSETKQTHSLTHRTRNRKVKPNMKPTAEMITDRAAAITAAMITKLDAKATSEKLTGANAKKIERYKLFFERNAPALDLLAKDDADTDYIADQIYAIDKLIDFTTVATSGHLNHNFLSSMHVFMLRAIVTLDRLKKADAPIDVMNVIWCAMNGEIQPKNNAELYMRGKIGYSSEKTQGGQVLNVLRTLRIVNERESDHSKRLNLKTEVCKRVLKALDGQDLAFLKA